MQVKTYGVPGLSEWHGKLKVGSIETNVSFIGGTASPSGSQPAYMTTKDPIAQFVIENSKEFKNGFIILLLTQEVEGVHPRMAVAKSVPANKPNQPTTTTLENSAPVNEPVEPAVSEEPHAADATGTVVEGEGMPEGSDAEESDEGTEGDGVQTIEVGCKADAVEWLKEHFPTKGYNGNNLRANAAFEAACNEAGVRFIIKNA